MMAGAYRLGYSHADQERQTEIAQSKLDYTAQKEQALNETIAKHNQETKALEIRLADVNRIERSRLADIERLRHQLAESTRAPATSCPAVDTNRQNVRCPKLVERCSRLLARGEKIVRAYQAKEEVKDVRK